MSILVDSFDEDTKVDLNQEAQSSPEPREEVQVPDKFKDKSKEDVVQSYTSLESELGRLRNELGDYRTMTDRFLSLEEKRVEDLGPTEDDFTIDPTELLSNPEEVLDKYYEKRRGNDSSYNELQERLNRLEGQVSTSSFETLHPDAGEITASPEFADWVKSDSYRGQIAYNAGQTHDTAALDYLLKEFKSSTGRTTNVPQDNLASARAVSTESSKTGTTASAQKRFSRRELVKLRMTNSAEYSARSKEILQAYAEGRVDD